MRSTSAKLAPTGSWSTSDTAGEGRLQSGSKTAVPVARDKAEQIFDDLVGEKVGKGYHEPGATPAAAAATVSAGAVTASAPVDVAAQREAAILARLRYAERVELGPSGFSTHWKLSRVIWRAGELRIKAAEPSLWFILQRRAEAAESRAAPPPCRPARCRPGALDAYGRPRCWAGREL